MIHLIDGMGQLGEALKKILPTWEDDIVIYHKWNVWDKDDPIAQKKCLDEFCEYANKNIDKRIVFISTDTEKNNVYRLTKAMAEKHLKFITANCKIIRLPILIGKGACEKFRKEDAEYYGVMNLISVEDAAREIVDNIYGNKEDIRGEMVSAKMVKKLIQYGKNGI